MLLTSYPLTSLHYTTGWHNSELSCCCWDGLWVLPSYCSCTVWWTTDNLWRVWTKKLLQETVQQPAGLTAILRSSSTSASTDEYATRSRTSSSNFLPVQPSALLVCSILFSAAETDFLNNLITQISQGRDFFLARDVEIHTSCQL